MIKDKRIADSVAKEMVDIFGRLNDSIFPVQEGCSDAEFRAYRLAIGKVMGELMLEVLTPIFAEHPDSKPAGWA